MTTPLQRKNLQAVTGELRLERGAALARQGQRLEAALARLDVLRQEVRQAQGAAKEAARQAYAQQREEAELRRWYLVVQREALGLCGHQDLDAVYPVPPKAHELD